MKTYTIEFKVVSTIDKSTGRVVGEAWFRKEDNKLHRPERAAMTEYDLTTGNPICEDFIADGKWIYTVRRNPETGETMSVERCDAPANDGPDQPPPQLKP